MPRILIADDQADVRDALRLLLKGEGFDVEGVDSPKALLASVEIRSPDLLLMDLNYARDTTSGEEGLEVLVSVQALDPSIPIVVMTGYGSIELAVKAMHLGAKDFIQKPWDNLRLVAILNAQIELAKSRQKSRNLQAENEILRGAPATIVAESLSMKSLLSLALRVAPSDAHVLLTGENGTGKSLLAKVIHEASGRASSPFITINAGGLSEGLLESELFGHVKGAYTDARNDRVGRFELAEGGTLLLDEIGNAPLSLQAKLLRVIETGEFEKVGSSRTIKANARLLSATNASLVDEVRNNRFRQDLLFRLNTIELHIPPLRERVEDIRPLAVLALNRHVNRYRKAILGFESEAIQALERHSWPGNVRELDHVIERSVLLSLGPQICRTDLMLDRVNTLDPEDLSLDDLQSLTIRKALARHGSASAAAEALGLSRSAFYRRLQKFGIG